MNQPIPEENQDLRMILGCVILGLFAFLIAIILNIHADKGLHMFYEEQISERDIVNEANKDTIKQLKSELMLKDSTIKLFYQTGKIKKQL